VEKIEERINRWHYEARDPVDPEGNDIEAGSSACVISKCLSLSNLLSLLQATDKRDDATAVEDVIKEMHKGNTRYELRNLMERGTQRLVAGDTTHALDIFRGIVEQDPTYADVWNKIGTAEYMLGRYTEAMDATKRALEFSPFHIQSLNGLGLIYFERKEYEVAIQCFEKSLELDPWNAISTKYSSCRDIMHRMALENERKLQQMQQQEKEQQEQKITTEDAESRDNYKVKPNEKD
jgi:tetratricopeptide (TPR) repeat protein